MSVQEWVFVAENLDIDPEERRVQFRAGNFDGFGQNIDAAQIGRPFGARQSVSRSTPILSVISTD
jgi:hypothetical protein